MITTRASSPLSRIALTAAVLGSLLMAAPAAAEIYRWTDADGVVHFTDRFDQVPESQRPAPEVPVEAPAPPPAQSISGLPSSDAAVDAVAIHETADLAADDASSSGALWLFLPLAVSATLLVGLVVWLVATREPSRARRRRPASPRAGRLRQGALAR